MVLARPVDWMDWKYHSSDHCDSVGSLWNNGYVLFIICLKVGKKCLKVVLVLVCKVASIFTNFPKKNWEGHPPTHQEVPKFNEYHPTKSPECRTVSYVVTGNRTFAVVAPRLWKLPSHCRLDEPG